MGFVVDKAAPGQVFQSTSVALPIIISPISPSS
jgi:hypothetical protein